MKNLRDININITALGQYILLYLMLLIPGSCLFAKWLENDIKYYIVLCIYIILFLTKKKYRASYAVIFSFALFIIVVFVRLITNGGVGISVWLQFTVCLCSVQFAICCDKKHFLSRFIKIVCAFSVISLIFWLTFLIFPQFLDHWPAIEYITNITGSDELWSTTYYGKGVFLYSALEAQSGRNCGIYTEPGVHQIVLNSALFVLLFWKNRILGLNRRKFYSYLVLLILTIFSCQSTTGYIAFLLIVLCYAIFGNKEKLYSSYFKLRRNLICLVLLVTIALFVEYAINDTSSIFYNQILNKLFPDGSFSLNSGTGQYRLNTILASIQSVIEHPLGIGYDNFALLNEAYEGELVAASIMSFAAVFGLFPWIVMMIFVVKPVISSESKVITVLFILLFINTTLAQTDLFYPGLMIVPTYLSVIAQNKMYPFGVSKKCKTC